MSKATLNHLMTLWTIIWYPIFTGAAPAAMIYAGNWYNNAGGKPEAIWGYPAVIGGLLAGLVALYFVAYNGVSNHPEDGMPSLFGLIALAIAAWPLSLCVLIGYGLYTYGYDPLLQKMKGLRDNDPPPPAVAASHSHAHTTAHDHALAAEQLVSWMNQQQQVASPLDTLEEMFANDMFEDEEDDDLEDEDEEDEDENYMDSLFYPFDEDPTPSFEITTINVNDGKARKKKVSRIEEPPEPEKRTGPLLPGGPKEWDE